ncbi:hypothetical protein Hanom_Chr07g00606571 [Helianthus anomalus]
MSAQLDKISKVLQEGHELAIKVLNSSRLSTYKKLHLSRKKDMVEKKISKFVQGTL